MQILLFCFCGVLPFVLGGALNFFMVSYPDIMPPFQLLGILFLLLWGLIGFGMKAHTASVKHCVLRLNLLALVVLCLLGIQEFVLKAYWPNFIGTWTQLYYLPLLPIGFGLTQWSHVVFSAYCVSFLLMLGASTAGCILRQRFGK